jgi:flagellar biogenesis protein FliO
MRARSRSKIDVVGAHPLGPGLAVYVIDVDGRRTVLAAGSHAMCVLSTYRAPQCGDPEGQQPAIV